MEQKYLDLIEETRVLQYPYKIQPPASIDEVEELRAKAARELNYSLPTFYLDLLQITDGIACNGNQLYGSSPRKIAGFEDREGHMILGLVDANLIWREYAPNNQYIFFAESGDRLYCHNLINGKFESVDRITKELTYAPSSFDTCEELLELLLNHMLDRYGEEDGEE
jgi:hypothetical protein